MDINGLKYRKLSHPDILPDVEVMLCLSISKNSQWVAACGTEVRNLLMCLFPTQCPLHAPTAQRESFFSDGLACVLQGNAYLWSLDEAKASQGTSFQICTSHMHTCVLDPDEIGGVPMRLVVGTDAGKLAMINLDAEKFGNQLGVIDTKAFGTGAVRHVRRHPFI